MSYTTKYQEHFKKEKLFQGRSIAASKSYYKKEHENNIVFFNSYIGIKKHEELIIIWYGDIDISKDYQILQKISKKINKKIYVFHESSMIHYNIEEFLDFDKIYLNETINSSNIVKDVWDSSMNKVVMKNNNQNHQNKEEM
jgi:hypothetical protein